MAVSIFIVIAAYFLPTIIAGLRRHLNGGAIFMFNLLLGWTLLGWALALVWASTNNTKTAAEDAAALARLDALERDNARG